METIASDHLKAMSEEKEKVEHAHTQGSHMQS